MYNNVIRIVNYLGSRQFAIILLVITTSIIITTNLLPNPALMTAKDAQEFVQENPLLTELSNALHVMNITKTPYFFAVPFFILVSITICTYKRAVSYFVKKKRETWPFNSRDLEIAYFGCDKVEEEIVALVEKGRWKTTRREDGKSLMLYAAKGEKGIWGSFFFHAGMNIIIVGGIVSLLTSYNGILRLTEGYLVESKDALIGLSAKDMEKFPYEEMILESFDAVYEGVDFAVDYTAKLMMKKKTGEQKREIIKVNKALNLDNNQLALIRYSFSPRFIITEKEGDIIQDAYINLVVTSAEQEDTFEIRDMAMTIKARFFADYYIEGGLLKTRSATPDNPAFLLEFFKYGEKIGSGILPMQKKMDIDGGKYSIEFRDLKHWITLSVSSDYGLTFFKIGLMLVVFGLVVRMAFNEKKIWISISNENGMSNVALGGRALYFPALFEEELKVLAEKMDLKATISTQGD